MRNLLPPAQVIAGTGYPLDMPPLAGYGQVVAGSAEEQALFRYPSQCPFCGTARGRLPEWPKGAVCKTVG